MHHIVNLFKPKGLTPLQALEKLQEVFPEYKNMPLTYAGRLDPMAEGVLLVLMGEATKQKETYLHLDKEYDVEILCGIETDTHDILGKVTYVSEKIIDVSDLDGKKYIGKFLQPYPSYSSKPVQGKPLFQWAREGRLDEIEIPVKEVEIYAVDMLETKTISAQELLPYIQDSIKLIQGDFRQEEILHSWQGALQNRDQNFKIIKIRVKCSSGTYMRSLAQKMGGIALSIKRTRVGTYDISTSLHFSTDEV